MSGPARRLGLWSAAALVVANMIGAGVFTTSGFALADLGRREPVLLAWAVGGVLAFCGALSYGALARRFPESGGEYLFLSRTVHPLAGFLAGWVSLLAGFTAPIAAAGLGLQAYLAESFGVAARPEWIGTAAIAAAALLHGLRLREGVVLQNLAVVLKLVLIAGLVGLGALRVPAGLPPPAPAGFELGAFAVTLVWISFAYSGWNAAVYIAGEVRDPERALQRSLVLATATVTAAYLALNAVFLYAAPIEALAGRAEVGAIAAEALGGRGLRRAVSLLVALALFTSISSMVMAGPRVYARMAEDGLFPRLFRPGPEVPRAAVALQAGLALVVLWVSGLVELLGYIGFTLGVSAAATVAALVALRLREGAQRVPVPGFPWVPGLFVAATLAAAAFMALREPLQAALGLATVLLGLPLYAALRRRASATAAAGRAARSTRAPRPRLRVQFIHGLEGSPSGSKARLFAEHFDALTPAMDTADFEGCVALHAAALARFRPHVLVGSSFGGAVAVALLQRGLWRGPTLLLAQAALRHGLPARLPAGVRVWLVHGSGDALVPVEESRRLAAGGDPELVRLLEVDDDHPLHATLRSSRLVGLVRELARAAGLEEEAAE